MPQINLLPPEYRQRRKARRLQNIVAIVGVVFLAFLLLLYTVQRNTVSRERSKLAAIEATNQQLQGQVAALQQFAQLQQDVNNRRASLGTALTGDVAWSKFLNDLSLIMPDNSWLVNLTASATPGVAPNAQPSFGTVAFQGFVFDFPGMAGWLTRIAQIEGLTFVYLTNGQKQDIGSRSVVSFSANANLIQALLSARCQVGKPCP